VGRLKTRRAEERGCVLDIIKNWGNPRSLLGYRRKSTEWETLIGGESKSRRKGTARKDSRPKIGGSEGKWKKIFRRVSGRTSKDLWRRRVARPRN